VVFQLAIVIIIPIIMGIVFAPPFDAPEAQDEEMKSPSEPISDIPDRDFLYFFLMLVWLFFLIRILFQIKRKTFNLQRKF
jgi:Na+/H+ antiporter NhaD/arsenite permease-like protein